MTHPVSFALASLLLLFAPGPTNTLLFASAASAGFRRSASLPLAEIAGYLTAFVVLLLGVGPLVRSAPVLAIALKLGCTGYLVFLSVTLWLQAGRGTTLREPIKPVRLYVATVINPKALVFAFLIVPFALDGQWLKALPYLVALVPMIALAGFSWIAAGDLLGSVAPGQSTREMIQRLCAVLLLAFAGTLAFSVMR